MNFTFRVHTLPGLLLNNIINSANSSCSVIKRLYVYINVSGSRARLDIVTANEQCVVFATIYNRTAATVLLKRRARFIGLSESRPFVLAARNVCKSRNRKSSEKGDGRLRIYEREMERLFGMIDLSRSCPHLHQSLVPQNFA